MPKTNVILYCFVTTIPLSALPASYTHDVLGLYPTRDIMGGSGTACAAGSTIATTPTARERALLSKAANVLLWLRPSQKRAPHH